MSLTRRVPIRPLRPAPGIVEQDPRDWTDGVVGTMDALLIGDRAGASRRRRPLRPGQHRRIRRRPTARRSRRRSHGQDNRAAPEAADLDAGVTDEDRIAWWGAPLPIGASHVLARMAWMARARPEVFAATRHVLTPKDYCLRALVGEAVADPMSNFFVVGLDLAYVDPLISRVAGARERLPPLRFFTDIVGEIALGSIRPARSRRRGHDGRLERPVRRGGAAGRAGRLHQRHERDPGDRQRRRIGAPGVVTFPTAAGLTVNAGPTQSGGDSLRWWGGVIGRDVEGVLALASEADRNGRPILFLPHLEGERAPLWDAQLRGAFIGLDRRASGPDHALAVMEGVALSARMLLRGLRRGGGRNGAAPVSRRRRSALRSLGADQGRLPRAAAGPGRLSRRRLPGRGDHGGGRRRRLPIARRGDLRHDARRAFVRAGSAHESRATTRCTTPIPARPRRFGRSESLARRRATVHDRLSPRHHAAASISARPSGIQSRLASRM